MTDLLDRAVETARTLPPDAQDDLARMMLSFAGQSVEVYRFTADDRQAVARSRDAAARGEFATDEQLQAHRARYRL